MTEHLIQRLGHLGDGVALGPVFASRTLPGETVTGTKEGDRLTDIRVVTPSEHRVKAPCAHYNACGGCALQHASDAFVADWKRGVVVQALAAQQIEANIAEVFTSPPQSRRRATLSGRRTKKGALVGFHARASDTIVPVPNCLLLHPDLMKLIPVLEDLTRVATSRSAEVSYTVTLSDAGVDLAVDGAKPMDTEMKLALPKFAGHFARIAWNGEPALLNAAPGQHFGTARVVPPAGGFLQATPEGEAALVAGVRDALGGAQKLVDLFSGCGTFTFPAAERAAVLAVESDADLIAALDHGVRNNQGHKPITTAVRDLFRNPLLASELDRFDGIIIDPPRAGAEAQVAQIASCKVPVIAFVSCNPVTFAREAATLLRAGYTLDWVRVIDQFRWSPHIEVVARLSRPE